MKKTILSLALSLVMSVPAFAATTIGDWAVERGTTDYQGTQEASAAAGKSANGIVFSRHNLSSYGEHYQATTSVIGTSTKTVISAQSVISTEVCVFCHTPHFGQAATAPLWNRGSSATGYTAYGATTTGTAGSTLAGSPVAAVTSTTGGSSLACLSCHDGVTTFDNLINKPGKGTKVGNTGTTSWGADLGWIDGEIGVGDTIGDTNAGGNGSVATTKDTGSRLNIGAGPGGARSASNIDLSNDHPINVAYLEGAAASLRPIATTISSIAMVNARSNGDDAARDNYGRSDNLWAVKGFISANATINDLLRDTGKVQCSSCHDPHYKNQTNTDPAVVCGYLPSIANYDGWATGDVIASPFYGGPYVNETLTPTYDGCMEAATLINPGVITKPQGTATVSGVISTSVFIAGLDITPDVYSEYVGATDSDGLFLRRVGGNSNSGVCRTCHNK